MLKTIMRKCSQLEVGMIDKLDWVEIYSKSRLQYRNDNNEERMVCFKRIFLCSFKVWTSGMQQVSVSSSCRGLGVFVHPTNKKGKPMAYQPPVAHFSSHILWDWQTVFSPKIGQRKMKTDGPDGALAGALTCSLQAPRDLLYSFPPSSSLLFALFSVILFHVAHGTNKYRGTPSTTYTNADSDLSISPCPSAGQVTSFFPELDPQPWLTNHEDRLSCPLLRSKNQKFFFLC